MNTLILLFAALSLDAAGFDAEAGLARARAAALNPRADYVSPKAVVWTEGKVADPEKSFADDGECAVLSRKENDKSAPVFVLDFGKSSVEGRAVVRVRSMKGSPVLRLAYANYPDAKALQADGDFNEASRARYMGRDFELPVLPANINRYELYRVARTGTFVAPMVMPQARYVRIQLDTPGEVAIDSVVMRMKGMCDASALDGYFESSDPDMNRLWQIGVWTAQLATIGDTWAWNSIEGRLQPRKLTKGGEVHLTKAEKVLPDEGSLSVGLECGWNPSMLARAGLALMAADDDNALLLSISESGELSWVRRNNGADNVLAETRFDVSATPLADGREHALSVSWRANRQAMRFTAKLDGAVIGEFDCHHPLHGRRIGFWSRKGWWPSFDNLVVKDASGKTVFSDGFDDERLGNWDFERPEAFVSDGAKRDRLVWSGDLYWAGRNFYYAFRDSSSMVKTIALLARNQTPEGYVQACPFAEQPSPGSGEYGPFESDEFAAWFLPVLHDYWWHTGDGAAVRRFYPNVKRLLGYLGASTRPDGLFEQRFETSKHAFAPALQMGDVRHRSYMDVLLWMCWKGGADMARALGEEADAKDWAAKAHRLRESANRAYWDDVHGIFRGSLERHSVKWQSGGESNYYLGKMVDGGETPEGTVAMEPNALAVESGFANAEQASRICPQLVAQSWVRKFILLSAIAKGRSGYGEDAWQIISTNRWGVFARADWDGPWATAEGMDPPRYGSCDQSHPDVAPAGFISSCYLGVVPLEAGYRRFSFSPKPTDKLTWAEGRVPTANGAIDARWERTASGFVFKLSVPDGTEATVVSPDGKVFDKLGPGWHRVVSSK